METKTYRQTSCVAVVGALIAIVGGVISSIAFYHLSTGIPLWQANSKYQGGQHLATRSELWFDGLGGLPLILLGLAVLLLAINSTVTIDNQGIRATNLFRRVTFRANWSEITSVERLNPGPASSYKLTANGKTLQLDSSITGFQDLINVVKAKTHNHTNA